MKKHFMKSVFLFLVFVFSNLSNAAVVNVSLSGNNVWDDDYDSIHPISFSFSYDTSNPLKGTNPDRHEISYELLSFNIDVGKDLNIDGFDTKHSSIYFYEEYGHLDMTLLSISFRSSFENENFAFFASFYYYPWLSPWLGDFESYVLSVEELSKIIKADLQSDTVWAYYTGPYFGNVLESGSNINLDPSTLVVSYDNVVPEPGSFWLLGLGIILMGVLRRSSHWVLSS